MSPRSNIPKILWMNFFWMFLVIIPVIVPFFKDKGLSMEQVYILQAVFGIGVTVLEVPSGYFSDLFGRKKTLMISGVFHGLGFTIFAFAESFSALAVAELILAVGLSFFSGTDQAMLYDSVESISEAEPRSALLGKRVFYGLTGETLASLLGGALVLISLHTPAIVNAVTSWLPFFIACTLIEPDRQKMSSTQHKENIRMIRKVLFQESKTLRLVLFNLSFFGLATLLAVWAFQALWERHGIPLSSFGYLWAAYNLVVGITGRYADRVENRIGMRVSIALIAGLVILGYLGLGLSSAKGWVVALVCFGFCFQLSRGLNQVILRHILNVQVESKMRATANSVASLGVRVLFVVLGPAMGYMIDHQGYAWTFFIYGIFYIAVALLFSVPLIRRLPNH